MGQNLDEIGDIYDHTGQYFGEQENDKDFQEVGVRKLRGDIADEEFYPSKKVSRKEREEALNTSSDNESMASEEGEGEEEGEDSYQESDDQSSLEDFQIKK